MLETKIRPVTEENLQVLENAEYNRLAYKILTGLSSKPGEPPSIDNMMKSLNVMYSIYLLRYTDGDNFFEIAKTRCDLSEEVIRKYILDGDGLYSMFGNPFSEIRYILGQTLGSWDPKSRKNVYRVQQWKECKSAERRLQVLVEAEMQLEEQMGIRSKITMGEHPALNDPMEKYVERMYQGLFKLQTNLKRKMPSKKRMQKSLRILYVLKHKDRYGYRNMDELERVLCRNTGISTDVVRTKVFGPVISKLYPGLRMVLEMYVSEFDRGISLKKGWRILKPENKYQVYVAVEARMNRELLVGYTESGES